MSLRGRVERIVGHSLGLPRLEIYVEVQNGLGTDISVLGTTADAFACQPRLLHDHTRWHFLNYGRVDTGNGRLPTGDEARWVVGLPIFQHTLQDIEDIRAGGDLGFLVKLSFTVAATQEADQKRYGQFISGSIEDSSHSRGLCVQTIPQSDWVKLLADLGYRDRYLIEIPLKSVPKERGFERALSHLTTAWSHFANGDDEETLASCHKAFEYLAKRLKTQSPDQNAFQRLLQSVDDDKMRDDLKRMMHYMCAFFHAGRHESGRGQPRVSHKEAEYSLILTQATLAYLAKHWVHGI